MHVHVGRTAAACLVLACAGPAFAAEEMHRAHEHGVGALNVAVETGGVEIELIAPGADIVGFEHEASSEADREALGKAVETLRDGSGLFVMPDDAQCSLSDVSVESGLLDDDGHEEEHSDEHEEEQHAEFRARYRFDCAVPEELDAIGIRYFDTFPSARELDASVLTESGQTSVELTPDAARLSL